MRTTLAKQLAVYVVLYSPVQMAADLIENYADEPAFQFVRDVAVDWDTTRVLDGKIGDYVVVARKERGADRWYVAEVYADGAVAHWLTNPQEIVISRQEVDADTVMRVRLAAGGGWAVRIRARE